MALNSGHSRSRMCLVPHTLDLGIFQTARDQAVSVWVYKSFPLLMIRRHNLAIMAEVACFSEKLTKKSLLSEITAYVGVMQVVVEMNLETGTARSIKSPTLISVDKILHGSRCIEAPGRKPRRWLWEWEDTLTSRRSCDDDRIRTPPTALP